ncbi:hypothetical protein KSS87_009052 [Heliosperma pusillum]|nr:hypothetical protein KSS87_009052 [Heliosperma pusillum]
MVIVLKKTVLSQPKMQRQLLNISSTCREKVKHDRSLVIEGCILAEYDPDLKSLLVILCAPTSRQMCLGNSVLRSGVTVNCGYRILPIIYPQLAGIIASLLICHSVYPLDHYPVQNQHVVGPEVHVGL